MTARALAEDAREVVDRAAQALDRMEAVRVWAAARITHCRKIEYQEEQGLILGGGDLADAIAAHAERTALASVIRILDGQEPTRA